MQNPLVRAPGALARGVSCLGRWLLGVLIVGYVAAALVFAFQMSWSAAFLGGIGPAGFLVLLLVMLAALAGPLSLWMLMQRHGPHRVLPGVGLCFLLGFLLACDHLLDALLGGLALAGIAATLAAVLATGPVADAIADWRRCS